MKRHDSYGRTLGILLALVLTLVLVPELASAQHVNSRPTPEPDPIGAGWWRLNQQKSSYGRGSAPLARSLAETRHYYLLADASWVMAIFTEFTDGRRSFSQTVFKLDGQARPSTYSDETLATYQATGATSPALSSQTQIDPYTVRIRILAADGSVVTTNTRSLSADGETFTLTSETFDDRGELVKTTRVFERLPL